jgi:hypothetical protein
VASFFFHPYYDVSYLQQIVQGIQALGYTFVSPQSLLGPGQSVSVPVTVTTPTLPAATAGQAYTASLSAADGTAPCTWAVTSGSLPAGLTLNPSTGAISGTPTTAGTTTITVTATDSTVTPTVGNTSGSTVLTPTPGQASATLTLTVNPGALGITTSSLAAGTVGQAYSSGALSATGGVGPYTWSISSGSLPAGLNLNPATGAITGTPTAAGSSTVGVTVTDSSTPAPASATQTFTIAVLNPNQLAISTASLPAGVVNLAYSAPLAAAGGNGSYTWTASGVPAGIAVNPSTGVVSGTPTRAGAFTMTVKVTDSSKPIQTATAKVTLTINAAPTIATSSLGKGTVGQPYSATLSAGGGATPYTWSISSGSLPAGLSLNSATGTITGTPTAAGSSTVGVTLTDSSTPSAATATRTFTLAVNPAKLQVTTISLSSGQVGQSYSATLAANGGTMPYTWTASGLPAGVTVNASGAIGGTPTKAGNYTVKVKVTDSAGSPQAASATFPVSISR